MDLLAKVIIIAILLIIIIFALFSMLPKLHTNQKIITRSDAINMIKADILNKTPNANISLISASPAGNNSWDVSFTVVYNGTKACPELLEEDFDYPAFGFYSTNTTYTSNCKVYGYTSAPYYVLSMPQTAIAESYAENTLAEAYVNRFGYSSTNVHAVKYVNFTSNDITALGFNSLISSNIVGNSVLTNIWLINYSASDANYNLYLLMHQSGNIITSLLLNKTK